MAKITFEPLRIRRLSQFVEDSIKDLILSGQIKVGAKMPTELELSRQFGVSIVTVREALRGLETFGIIQRTRGKTGGTYVAQTNADTVKTAMRYFMSSRDLTAENLNQVRVILEPATVALAAKKIAPNYLEDLETNVKNCRAKLNKKIESFSTKDFFEIEDRTTEYHKLIAEAVQNPLLTLIVDYMMDFLASYERSKVPVDYQYAKDSTEWHEKILEDLKAGDARAAEKHMLEHVTLVGNYYADVVEKSPPKIPRKRAVSGK